MEDDAASAGGEADGGGEEAERSPSVSILVLPEEILQRVTEVSQAINALYQQT